MFNGKMKGLMIIHEHPGARSTENKNIRRIFVKKSLFFQTKIESALPFTSASKPTFPRGFLLQRLLHCY
jgi:hypothetical protein